MKCFFLDKITMKSKARLFKYSDLGRDILFESIKTNPKDKTKRDFLDCCKCLVWEENRTRYELDESFRKNIDLSRVYASTLNQDEALNHWMDISVELTLKLEFYRTHFPFNVPQFPKYPYLKYSESTRSKWKYNPLEERDKFTRKLLLEGLTGDKEDIVYQYFNSSGETVKLKGKEVSRTVPVTIHIDPLLDESVSKRIVASNFDVIYELAQKEKRKQESKGRKFLSPKQIAELKKIEKGIVESTGGVFSALDPIYKPKPLKTYNSALQFLGLYRLLECEGYTWLGIEKKYENYYGFKGCVPMSSEHYEKKVRTVLRLFPHK